MGEIERKHITSRMSKIVCHGDLVFLAGQTASGSASVEGDITAQTHEVLSRIDALLAEGKSHRSQLLSATIYLKSMQDFASMNMVWESWLAGAGAPARTTVQAHMGMPDLLVEVTVIAARLMP